MKKFTWTAATCAAVLFSSGCSGSTDVVGVLPVDVETGALEGASQSDGSGSDGVSEISAGEGNMPGQLSIVAGLREESWDGPTLDWPFAVSLREFFSEESWPGPFGPPPQVERRVIAAMGKPGRAADQLRFVAPDPEVVERLREVFEAATEAELDGDMVARVMRDRRSDEYRVVLGVVPRAAMPAGSMPPGSGACGYAPSHHGGACAEETADAFEHP